MTRLASLILSLMVLCACARLTAAQEAACTLKLAQLPQAGELRGFQLGMTTEQVRARVPHIVFGPVDQFGSSKTSLNPDFNAQVDKASFEGVRTVSLDFLDGRLISLWLGYNDSFKWKTLDEFTGGISESLKLPKAWHVKRGGRQMTCDGFQLAVQMVGGTPSLHITDELAQQALNKRIEDAPETQESQEGQEQSETHADPEVVPIIADKHTKTYYRRDCPNYNDVPLKERVTFPTTVEAEKAGYKLSKTCP
ncbi:MAG TPA: hypothetical protein VGO91_18130 [Pyrinomonadaceae bacterium]|jgi:hypothetical protein|nr:hypothetical protein [Pyrinomonadaceae bacterium]